MEDRHPDWWLLRPIKADKNLGRFVDADYEVLHIKKGSRSTVDAIRTRGIRHVSIDPSDWIARHGLHFLSELSESIVDLSVHHSAQIEDWSPISSLTSLRALSVGSGLSAVDGIALQKLTNLRTLGWGSTRVGAVSRATGLTQLNLFKTKLAHLEDLRDLTNLVELALIETNVKSLSGVERLTNLRRLDVTAGQLKSLAPLQGTSVQELHLNLCSKLVDYTALPEMKRLEHLTLHSCKKVLPSIDVLGKIPNLRRLHLEKLGTIESLEFLRPSKSLELLTWLGDVRIKDGQMGLLLELPSLKHVEFPDRRHHSHRWIEIVRELEKRTGLRFAQGRFQRIKDLVREDSDAH